MTGKGGGDSKALKIFSLLIRLGATIIISKNLKGHYKVIRRMQTRWTPSTQTLETDLNYTKKSEIS